MLFFMMGKYLGFDLFEVDELSCHIGSEDIGDKKRNGKPYGDIERYGLHELPHHPADERHRHHREDNGDGGDIGRWADLVGCLHDDLVDTFLVDIQMQTPVYVFDHDNGIIHNEPEREQEGKEGNTVDRLVSDLRNEKRRCKDHRYGYGHNHRFAPPKEGDQDQHNDENGDLQVMHQLIDRFICPDTVVTGDGESYTGTVELLFGFLDLLYRLFRNVNGIRSFQVETVSVIWSVKPLKLTGVRSSSFDPSSFSCFLAASGSMSIPF